MYVKFPKDAAKRTDPEAAAEMWDRWRSGDTSAVSRRLYTAPGQQAFDEIRRKYRGNPQFQEAVTRYTQEFERLLAKIGQNDRDGAQSRATLLSDALAVNKFNQRRTAEALGLSYHQLRHYLKKHALLAPR